MDFIETVTLVVPQIDHSLLDFGESAVADHGLIIETAAIHVGTTNNFNHYSEEALESSLESWVQPYPKPILLNHDPHVDPVGRVMAAKMDREADGTPYTRLQIAITDPRAIEKILDQRYLTGSVGGKALEAVCSICNTDWTKASAAGLPCKHRRGTAYKGQLAVLNMNNVNFVEYSFVNIPADGRSGVRPKGVTAPPSEESDDWVRPMRLFGINMTKEEVVEYTESESRDLLATKRKKEAAPLYLSLKGAFLSALAAQENDEVQEDEEDILAVSETLSEELSSLNEDNDEEDENEETTHLHLIHKKDHDIHVEVGYNKAVDEDPDDKEGGTEDPPTAAPGTPAPSMASDDEPVTGEQEEVEAEEAEISSDLQNKDDILNYDPRPRRAEGQEKTKARDVDPETSKGAPRSREEEEATDEVKEGEEESVTETDRELDERVVTLESTLAETRTQIDNLLAENVRLKSALKRNLAERVVDTKITLGMVEREEREMHLNEHMNRSASSLADSLRDLVGFKAPRPDYTDFPNTEESGSAVEDPAEKGRTMTEGRDEELESAPVHAEDILVDVLMGRRKI